MYIKYTELCTLFKMFCTLNTKKKKKIMYIIFKKLKLIIQRILQLVTRHSNLKPIPNN